MANNRDNFPTKTIEILKKRAAFICSNPNCKKMTVAPSEEDSEKILYIGRGAHISAAATGGPRFDSSMTEEQRSSIDNAIFLCSNCADMIDDNNGIDFSVAQLKTWKTEHEKWTREQLNKSVVQPSHQQVTYNVTSHNQTGGITAGVVNFEKPGRHLNDQLIQQLLSMLPDQNEKVKISAQMGNLEALTFAEEIRQHLLQRGFNINEVGQIMLHPPVIGQALKPDRDGSKHLIVGMQK